MIESMQNDSGGQVNRNPRRRFVCAVASLLAAASVSWIGLQVYRTRRQNDGIAAVHQLHGYLEYQHEALNAPPLPRPDMLRYIIGEEFFVVVSTVNLGNLQVTDAALEPLGGLRGLRELTITDSPLTGSGLAHLRDATQLRFLRLSNTSFTNASIVQLQAFVQLRELYLDSTRIDSGSLGQLQSLSKLEAISLADTAVDDASLRDLLPLKNLTWLKLDDTPVGDGGVATLQQLKNLRDISIAGTKITAEGARQLQQALPEAKVYWNSFGKTSAGTKPP